MRSQNYELIAEVKTRSPYDNWQPTLEWDKLFDLAKFFGDMISVHVETDWDGSLDLIQKARSLTDKPILAKGFNDTDKKIKDAIEAGATKVLRVGELPDDKGLLRVCLMEPRSLGELSYYPPEAEVVWNARDLFSGGHKSETFAQARAIWPRPRKLIQASYIWDPIHVHPEADGIIVGRDLVKFLQKRGDIS